jgi:PKD repeat protein
MDPSGSIVAYAWDFGDGATDTGKVVTHAYGSYGSYSVTLVVTDIDNLTTTTRRSIRILSPPTASFVVSPPAPNAGAPVSFNASSSSDADGTIVYYGWDFGDASGGSGMTVTHVYVAEGSYLVTLVVTDSDILPGTASHSLIVGPTNQPPVASFTATPARVLPGEVVQFDASASSDPEGPIVSYAWDFGDGEFASGAVVTHAYSAHGTYIVTLTVEDTDGATNQRSTTIVVSNRAPVIESVTPLGDDVGVLLGIQLTFLVAAADPDGDPLAITWRLDGVVVATGAASFVFDAAHARVYRLNVTVSDGSDAAWHEWTITVGPQGAESSGLFDGLALPLLIIVPVVAGLVGLLLWFRRRRSR